MCLFREAGICCGCGAACAVGYGRGIHLCFSVLSALLQHIMPTAAIHTHHHQVWLVMPDNAASLMPQRLSAALPWRLAPHRGLLELYQLPRT